LAVIVQSRESAESVDVFDLFYCDQLCGCIFANENGVWIYEPHAHAALILDADEIQHLGREISERSHNS
jgi:hypothetical protein